MVDRQWAQQRLHAAQLADDPHCQPCLVLGEVGVPGTAVHRLYHCPHLDQARKVAFSPALLAAAPAELDRGIDTAKWLRALVPVPSVACRVPPAATFVWHVQPFGSLVEGKLYTDGSRVGETAPDLAASCIFA